MAGAPKDGRPKRGDIIIAGRDKALCEMLQDLLVPLWPGHSFTWLPSPLKALNHLWQRADARPLLVVIAVVGLDGQQIELVHELGAVYERGQWPFVLVVADCERDHVLLEFLRLSGGDLVVDATDLSEQLQSIKRLVDDHWFVD
jgi:hypothetical protein